MDTAPSLLGRFTVSLVAGVTALCVAEGVASLVFGRSLTELIPKQQLSQRLSDEQRWESAAPRGIFRVHPDPLVGFVLRSHAELDILDSHVSTDELGLRKRPGPPASEDAIRLVVLGDSVAFGFGVDDDQTLAAQLEDLLAEARGPEARPVACRTVAVPGWNHRNAVHFLLDHMDELDPDLVLYMPIGNDLSNTDGVFETGHNRRAPDIATPDPWLDVSNITYYRVGLGFLKRHPDVDRSLLMESSGPPVLSADISPESRRRYDANAHSVALLDEQLRSRGASLILLQEMEENYFAFLYDHLARLGVDVPVLPLFQRIPSHLTLRSNPHPSAQAHGIMAVWVARDLLEQEWVEGGAGRPLPPLPDETEQLRASPRAVNEWVVLAREARRSARRQLRPLIDFMGGSGLAQIYGGLNADGSAGMRLLTLVAPAGGKLLVRLAPVNDRADLYPMNVDIQVDGHSVGQLSIPAHQAVESVLPAPQGSDPTAPLEVRLIPERWAVTKSDRWQTVSFRPVRIGTVASR